MAGKMDTEQALLSCMQEFRSHFISQSSEENSIQEERDVYKESLKDLTGDPTLPSPTCDPSAPL